MRGVNSVLGVLISMATLSVSAQAMVLSSPVLSQQTPMPAMYTCHGQDISPALTWTDVPASTEAFAIIMRDPDAQNKNWIHCLMYNIPLGTTGIPDNYAAKITGVLVGKNSFGHSRYEGPCPQSGSHHYRFELYALDQALYVNGDLTVTQLESAMAGHILGMTSLTVSYAAPRS